MVEHGTPYAAQNYVTHQEALDWITPLDGDAIPPSSSLDLIVGMACEWVQRYLGRPFAPTLYDQRFDGSGAWNGTVIELPHYPVLEVVSVVEYWGTSGAHVLSESTPTSQVDGWQCEYQVGRLIRVFPGLVQKPWFPGSRNIEVKWEAGFNPIPRTVKLATLELVKHWYINTQQNPGVGAPVGPDSYGQDTMAGLWAGLPNRITGLLEPYLQVGIG